MINNSTQNIYLEILISHLSKAEIWQKILDSSEFKNLFTEDELHFYENSEGAIHWRRLLLWKVSGHYHIVSYQENMNLLMDITAASFSSTLLFTLEENEHGVLFRIDHRSFIGEYKAIYHGFFLKRWKSLIQHFVLKKNNDKN